MSNERDTHFKEFAKLLWVEILQSPDFADLTSYNHHLTREQADAIETLIARRAYDLVLHTAYHISVRDLESLLMVEVAEKIPDMDSFPEQSQP